MSYRLTREELEDHLCKANKMLRKICKTEDIVKGFVDTTPVKTYCLSVSNLRDLLQAIKDFTQEIIEGVDKNKTLYIRKEINVRFNDTTHMCPRTFDYIENPKEGKWVINCRLCQKDNNISKRLFKEEGAIK